MCQIAKFKFRQHLLCTDFILILAFQNVSVLLCSKWSMSKACKPLVLSQSDNCQHFSREVPCIIVRPLTGLLNKVQQANQCVPLQYSWMWELLLDTWAESLDTCVYNLGYDSNCMNSYTFVFMAGTCSNACSATLYDIPGKSWVTVFTML